MANVTDAPTLFPVDPATPVAGAPTPAYPFYVQAESSYVFPDIAATQTLEDGELAAIVIQYSFLFLDTLVVAYAIWRSRTFKPLKARQLNFAVLTLFGTCFCFVLFFFLFDLLCLSASFCFLSGANMSYRVFPTPYGFSVAACIIINSTSFSRSLLSLC